MVLVPTTHIGAKEGQIAQTVVLTGDPMRIRLMAKKFLKKARCVSRVRGNFCYTGIYKGHKVSMMSCGMGAPSMAIYSYELFNFYGVQTIIRVGTAGAIDKNLHIGDIVASKNVLTDTNIYDIMKKNKRNNTFACSKKTLTALLDVIGEKTPLKQSADKKSLIGHLTTKCKFACGKTFSTDSFYEQPIKENCLCVEMECGALYFSAKKFQKDALCILTISDEVYSGKKSSSKEREEEYSKMFRLALDTAIKGEENA